MPSGISQAKSNEKTRAFGARGRFDSLKAAINNGADAVYLGLGGFNARANATNFSKDNIREAVSLAHLFGVKVYCAFNTVISYSRNPRIIRTRPRRGRSKGRRLYSPGHRHCRDSQALLSRYLPSRQHPDGHTQPLRRQNRPKLGIKRVILSRETKLEDIKAIKEKHRSRDRIFRAGRPVRCLQRRLLHERARAQSKRQQGQMPSALPPALLRGNRGQKAGEGYLLSPSDLCLIENLKLLADSGVSAFKIEGRLRRAGYVAEAVSCYRKAIDGGFPPSGEAAIERLKKVFYRGEYIKNAYLEDVHARQDNKQKSTGPISVSRSARWKA